MKSIPSTRGPRRGNRSRSDGRRRSGDRRSGTVASKPAPTLWQKIVSFFSGPKKQPPVRKAEASLYGRLPDDDDGPTASTRTSRPVSSSTGPRTVRKPEAVEVTTPRLYVGNLSFDATESDLSELFNGVGQVVTAEVVSHKQTQRSKGFAFVQMETVEEAKRAVTELHDKEFLGRKLVVSGAKNGDQHDSRGESSRYAA